VGMHCTAASGCKWHTEVSLLSLSRFSQPYGTTRRPSSLPHCFVAHLQRNSVIVRDRLSRAAHVNTARAPRGILTQVVRQPGCRPQAAAQT
jgi:hypothetical protein